MYWSVVDGRGEVTTVGNGRYVGPLNGGFDVVPIVCLGVGLVVGTFSVVFVSQFGLSDPFLQQ